MRYRDRIDAGRQLALALTSLRSENPIVLGLPRGGVPVAAEVARMLGAQLDVWVVRKVGAPFEPELGLGAVAEGGAVAFDDALAHAVGTSRKQMEYVIDEKKADVEERSRKFRRGAPRPDLRDRTVIAVDDGLATGGTMRAAVMAIQQQHPKRVVVAVPVAAAESLGVINRIADDVVCPSAVRGLGAIGYWYRDFTQTTDAEVTRLLDEARADAEARGASPGAP